MPTVADLDPDFWAQGMAMFIHHALAPWVGIVDRALYGAEIDRARAVPMTAIASAHERHVRGRGR